MGDVAYQSQPANDTDQSAPHSEAAETAIVAGALQNSEACRRAIDLVESRQIFDGELRTVFRAVEGLTKTGTPIDATTVETWLRGRGELAAAGGRSRLLALDQEFPEAANIGAHAEIVLDMHERREAIATCRRLALAAEQPVASWSDFKANARRDLAPAFKPRVRLAGRPIGVPVEEGRQRVREATSGRVLGVRYPWRCVEGMVGLLVRKRQTILAGRSEHGKTALAMQIAIAVAEQKIGPDGFGEAVYVLSGEMPGEALMTRTACSFAGVDVLRLEAGHATPDELDRVGREFDNLARLPIVIDDQPAAPSQIAQRVQAHKVEFAKGRARAADSTLLPPCRLQLVLGDHLQDLADFADGREERDRIGATAKGWLEQIAKEQDVATLLLSQIRRPSDAFKAARFPPWPTKEDLFGSSKIENSADTAIAVQRPELLMTNKVPAKWIGVVGICRLKSRFGGSLRRVVLGFDRGIYSEALPAAARGEPYYEDDDE